MSTTIRVSEETRDRLNRIARSSGIPMTEVVSLAADALERKVFFDRFDERYAALRSDSEEWASIAEEREVEGRAVSDRSR